MKIIKVDSSPEAIDKGVESGVLRLSRPDFERLSPRKGDFVIFRSEKSFFGVFKIDSDFHIVSVPLNGFVHSTKKGKFYSAYEAFISPFRFEPFWFSFGNSLADVFEGKSALKILNLIFSKRNEMFFPSFINVKIDGSYVVFTSVSLGRDLEVREARIPAVELEKVREIQLGLISKSFESAGEVVYESIVSKLFSGHISGVVVVFGDWHRFRFPFLEIAFSGDGLFFESSPVWFYSGGSNRPYGNRVVAVSDGSEEEFIADSVRVFNRFAGENFSVEVVVSPTIGELLSAFSNSFLIYYSGHGDNGWNVNGFSFDFVRFLSRVPYAVISDSCGSLDYTLWGYSLSSSGVKVSLLPIMRVDEGMKDIVLDLIELIMRGENPTVVSTFFQMSFQSWWKYRWFGSPIFSTLIQKHTPTKL